MIESIDLLPLSEVAERLDIPGRRVQQMLRAHSLAAVRDETGAQRVPADFLMPGEDGRLDVVKGLPGVLTLLADGRYTDTEAVEWLFTADDSLPGTPIEAMRAGRGTEVKRRAQALSF